MGLQNSQIILAKNIKMDKNYKNVLNYTTNEMLELLQSVDHFVFTANDYSFIRSQNSIFVQIPYTTCLQSNYIAFQNKDYSNKWFFAWIDDVIYSTDGSTEIKFTIDAWTTWWEDWNVKTCFVNRHHVNDDTIGLHTINENLDVGEVIQEYYEDDESYGNEFGYWIAVASNWKIKDNSTGSEISSSDKGSQYSGVTIYNNVVFGTQLFLFNINEINDFKNLVLFLMRTNNDGHIEDIENIFIIPNMAVSAKDLTEHSAKLIIDDNVFNFYTMKYNLLPKKFNTEINKIISYSDYTPKNNKCFVYPYNYLLISNNQGSNNIFKYENFNTDKCIFENQFSISIGGSGRLVPLNYKKMSTDDDESLTLGKYPTCAWSSDAFTNWLTANSVNMAVSLGLTAGSIASSALTGGATAPLIGGSIANLVGNFIGQFNKASLLPNIQGGQANGDIIWSSNRNKFSFRCMRVKTEYLKIIDDYFTRFGYAIKKLEVPNLVGRKNWNYVEIGSDEEIGYGSVPSSFMETINNACRSGITIWHNHENLGNFALDNSII